MDEIAERVAKVPVAFDSFAQIAQSGDDAKDPSTPWREDRQLLKLGSLSITRMAADHEGLSKSLLFLPNNASDAIETVDPMIEVRSEAYPISFGERQQRSDHVGCFSTLLSTGILRSRFPVAAKIAFATAGTMADVPASPIPPGASVLGTM
jgi:hypothetical protein